MRAIKGGIYHLSGSLNVAKVVVSGSKYVRYEVFRGGIRLIEPDCRLNQSDFLRLYFPVLGC
jgi:hypothetical protein